MTPSVKDLMNLRGHVALVTGAADVAGRPRDQGDVPPAVHQVLD